MIKSMILSLTAFLFLFLSCATVIPVERAVENIAWNTLDMISSDEKPVIAVYNLRNLTENGDVGKLIVSRLTSELANAARYDERDIVIVSRQTFEQIFEEQNFILSDLTVEARQIEMGRLLGADLILTGDLTLTGVDVFSINTQLINIETGEILGGDTFDFWIDMPREK